MATSSAGETFVIQSTLQGLGELADRLRRAVAEAGLDVEIVAYQEVPIPGDVLRAVIESQLSGLTSRTLEWHHDGRRWTTPASVLSKSSYQQDTWVVLYGDY